MPITVNIFFKIVVNIFDNLGVLVFPFLPFFVYLLNMTDTLHVKFLKYIYDRALAKSGNALSSLMNNNCICTYLFLYYRNMLLIQMVHHAF